MESSVLDIINKHKAATGLLTTLHNSRNQPVYNPAAVNSTISDLEKLKNNNTDPVQIRMAETISVAYKNMLAFTLKSISEKTL